MAVYHFTFHSHGSLMPDRPQRYVEKGKGILLPDPEKAQVYRDNLKGGVVYVDEPKQHLLIDECLTAAEFQKFKAYAVATESTHLHVLVSGTGFRERLKVRNGIKQSLSRALSKSFGQQRWLTQYASRKRVTEQKHFDYLLEAYLPSHSGWKWDERRGKYK